MSAMSDIHTAVRNPELDGIERGPAEAVVDAMRQAAGADRGEFVTRGELRRALWIQGGAIAAILTAVCFLPV